MNLLDAHALLGKVDVVMMIKFIVSIIYIIIIMIIINYLLLAVIYSVP